MRSPAGSNSRIAAALLAGILIGVVGYYSVSTYWNTAYDWVSSYLQKPQSHPLNSGLYIVGVNFIGSNVTVNLGNSGGGVPTPPGYGDDGVTARYIGAIIVQDGVVYYHYNWDCQLSTSSALAPGPFRYFSLTDTTTSVNNSWNLGKNSLVPDILSVNGNLAAGMIFHWTEGRTYTIYLQGTDNSIVYHASFTAP